MIASLRHRGLKRLFERGDRSRIGADMVDKVENILAILNRAKRPGDLDLPGFRVHRLRRTRRRVGGHRLGQPTHPLSLRRRRRRGVDLVDYHQELGAMPMHNPPHPGRIVRQECLELLRLSLTAAAKALGVSLSKLVNERRGISSEVWAGLQLDVDMARALRDADHIKVDRIERVA